MLITLLNTKIEENSFLHDDIYACIYLLLNYLIIQIKTQFDIFLLEVDISNKVEQQIATETENLSAWKKFSVLITLPLRTINCTCQFQELNR